MAYSEKIRLTHFGTIRQTNFSIDTVIPLYSAKNNKLLWFAF